MNDQQTPGEQICELSVGDVLQVGDLAVTVVDIDGDEVTFRIDSPDHDLHDELLVSTACCDEPSSLPR